MIFSTCITPDEKDRIYPEAGGVVDTVNRQDDQTAPHKGNGHPYTGLQLGLPTGLSQPEKEILWYFASQRA